MPRGGVIAGTVLDEHGEPAVGTQVRVYRYNRQSGVRTPQLAGNDATDDRGMYRIYGLQIGDYLVAAIPRPQAVLGGAIADRIQEAVSALAPQGPAGSQIAATVLDRLGAAQAGSRAAAAAARRTGHRIRAGLLPGHEQHRAALRPSR